MLDTVYLGTFQFAPLWNEEELDSLPGSGQSHTAEEEDREQHVGERRREVHHLRIGRKRCKQATIKRSQEDKNVSHLAGGSDATDDAQVANDPGHEEGEHQVPLQRACVLDALTSPQHAPATNDKMFLLSALQICLKERKPNFSHPTARHTK